MTTTTEPGRIILPSSDFLARSARAVVDRHRADWPDLSRLLMLVPDLHAVADVGRALVAAGGGGPLLLPHITTLDALACGVDIPYRVTPQSVREAELYALLVQREPFSGTDAWALAAELVSLFDLMTRARSPVDHDVAGFTETLRAAYRSGRNRALEFEAALVHELWWAQAPQQLDSLRAAHTLSVDAASAHALGLASLARDIESPVYTLALPMLEAVDQAFLDACARRVPVLQFEPGCTADDPLLDRTLALAWPSTSGDAAGVRRPPLRERAAALALACPDSALAGRFSIAATDSLEQQASAIDVAVRRALLAGERRIGVVVLDRQLARRARALLERAQVVVADEAGWLLSTTVAAACVGRLLDVAASRGYHRDLLDLLRSPFAFADLPVALRWRALGCLERVLADHNQSRGIGQMIALIDSDRANGGGPGSRERPAQDAEAGDTARAMLERVDRAIKALATGSRKPLAQWLDALAQALEHLGARESLAADAAGADLLDLIELRRSELATQRWQTRFSQWRAWFTRSLEAANFRPRDPSSPVVFTYLAATALRRFDFLVLAGADAAHLPPTEPPGSFFNPSVRARLGLSTRVQARARVERDLRLAITAAPRVLVTWQARVAGEQALLSPWFARLQSLHDQAYPGQTLAASMELQLAAVRAPAQVAGMLLPAPAGAPAPMAPPVLAPTRISVSGYETLVACPYRFYAGTLLGLRPQDSVSEALEKSDFGMLLHAILAAFHSEVPEVSALGPAPAIERLTAISRAQFSAALRRNFVDRAWLARWVGSIPAYVGWQLEREAAGWRMEAVEKDCALAITTPRGRTILLRGRLDRIDRRDGPASGDAASVLPDDRGTALSVIDYKTQGEAALRERAGEPCEHVQLSAYALLAGSSTEETLFLSITRDAVTACLSTGIPAIAAEANRRRLARLADALHESQPMPANGIARVCERCEVRGLCRRDFWVAHQDRSASPMPQDEAAARPSRGDDA